MDREQPYDPPYNRDQQDAGQAGGSRTDELQRVSPPNTLKLSYGCDLFERYPASTGHIPHTARAGGDGLRNTSGQMG